MRSRWDFNYTTTDFMFEKELKFVSTVTNDKTGESQTVNIRIEPSPDSPKDPNILQTGVLQVEIPLGYEEGEDLVFSVLLHFCERIDFDFGELKLMSFYTGERIPENKEEEVLLGDARCFVHMSLTEVGVKPTFSSGSLEKESLDIALVSQFNHAKKAIHPIEQFTGFFKVFETSYLTNSYGEKTKAKLQNDELYRIYSETIHEPVDRDSFNQYIDEIVKTRGKCSHLKNNGEYGYLPHSPEVETVVKRELPKLQHFAKAFIKAKK